MSLTLLRRPQLMVPQMEVTGLADIDWGMLRSRHGIRAVCFDKDNTLTAPYQLMLHPAVLESLEACRRTGAKMAVLSNSVGSTSYDPAGQMATVFETATGLTVIRHSSRKPDGAECILRHFNACRPEEIALVGDRLLTDTVMANTAGFFSIYVSRPLTIRGDNMPAIVLRVLERWLLRILRWWKSLVR